MNTFGLGADQASFKTHTGGQGGLIEVKQWTYTVSLESPVRLLECLTRTQFEAMTVIQTGNNDDLSWGKGSEGGCGDIGEKWI